MWRDYINVSNLDEALEILAERGERARIVAGATDLILEIERGVRHGIDTLVDITRVPGLDRIVLDEDETIHLGPMVTHNHCVASKIIRERALPLAQAAWEVGAPQIRNRGTIAGNLITASPANDTITPLMALGATVSLRSVRGTRTVPLSEFYTGVRQTMMKEDEILVDIAFPAMQGHQRGVFVKLGLRKAQAISVVNTAVLLTLDQAPNKGSKEARILNAVVTLGSIAPTIIHAREAEDFLTGRSLDEKTVEEAAELAARASKPIDDVRSSARYRREMVRVCVSRGLRSLAEGEEHGLLPESPVLLWGKRYTGEAPRIEGKSYLEEGSHLDTTINGQRYQFTSGADKTLLHLLRDEAGLIGTKEGCSEGECGACTVFLDGMAVMSCLVPAARAHGAEIVTIEGLVENGQLHPVQEAFIDEGAVQCGYCTPGFIMSAAKLLEERPNPSREDIQYAITGNLCRCTGYYKIVQAIESAAEHQSAAESAPTS